MGRLSVPPKPVSACVNSCSPREGYETGLGHVLEVRPSVGGVALVRNDSRLRSFRGRMAARQRPARPARIPHGARNAGRYLASARTRLVAAIDDRTAATDRPLDEAVDLATKAGHLRGHIPPQRTLSVPGGRLTRFAFPAIACCARRGDLHGRPPCPRTTPRPLLAGRQARAAGPVQRLARDPDESGPPTSTSSFPGILPRKDYRSDKRFAALLPS